MEALRKKNLNITILDGHSATDGGNNRMRKSFIRIAITALPLVLGLWLLTACYTLVGPGHAGIVVKQSRADRGVEDFPVHTVESGTTR